VTTPYQIAAARAAGADAVLLIVAAMNSFALSLEELLACARGYGLQALVETHTEDEARIAIESGARIIGVNCRDLKTFHTDPAITAGLLAQIPDGVVKIAESGIRGADDIHTLRAAGADGFLIGETLMRAERPGEKLKELMK
jgi:indole-3-glycerol phosphate synthase